MAERPWKSALSVFSNSGRRARTAFFSLSEVGLAGGERRRAVAQERGALAGEDVGQAVLSGGDDLVWDMGIHGLISYVDSGNLWGVYSHEC